MACLTGFQRILAFVLSGGKPVPLDESMLSGSSLRNKYFSKQETIGVDTTYTPSFTGKDLVFYSSKSIVLKLNNAGNDAINLAAHIGIQFTNQEISSVILSAVQANTDIELVITG